MANKLARKRLSSQRNDRRYLPSFFSDPIQDEFMARSKFIINFSADTPRPLETTTDNAQWSPPKKSLLDETIRMRKRKNKEIKILHAERTRPRLALSRITPEVIGSSKNRWITVSDYDPYLEYSAMRFFSSLGAVQKRRFSLCNWFSIDYKDVEVLRRALRYDKSKIRTDGYKIFVRVYSGLIEENDVGQ